MKKIQLFISFVIVVAIVVIAFWGKFNQMRIDGTSFIPAEE